MKLVILIPAYNEAAAIVNTVQSAKAFADVLVVNDRSTDNTAELAIQAGAQVVTADVNGGYDRALDLGFKTAKQLGYSHVLTFDADGQHPSELIPAFEAALQKFDLVVGIRPQHARVGEWIFALYTRMRYGLKDPLCGMKGYNLSLYDRVGFFDSLKSTGTELALRGIHGKISLGQIPIPIKDRLDESRFGNSYKANMRILRSLICIIKSGL